MFKKSDPYSFTKVSDLLVNNSDSTTTKIGSIYCEYQVTLFEDVQSNGVSSIIRPKNQQFILNCTQRIGIFNPTGLDVSPATDQNAYADYPAMINTFLSLENTNTAGFVLLDYSPQTVNTQVEKSASSGSSDGQSKTSSSSNTVGSSVSQTNTFGATVTAGTTFSGASATYEHSSTVSKEHSSTIGSDVSKSQSNDLSNSASMSIKDWGAYALVNPNNRNPSWTFGQEYPWDAIQCRKTTGEVNPANDSQVQLVIPTAMLSRLYDGVSLYPPSELSTYGVNFVMKASWLLVINNDQPDSVTLDHIVNYFTASHVLAGTSGTDTDVKVYIDDKPISLSGDTSDSLSTTINLNFMALSPLGEMGGAAIVGFIPNKFIVKPQPQTDTSNAVPFKIISATNDMMIQDTTTYPAGCDAGAGFSASETSLTAGFSPNCTALQMTIYIKVIDSVSNYMLYMKHWKTGATGVMLTMMFNGDEDTVITQYVDAQEAEGGESNMLSIALRNQNFTSVDYHDYLQLGLNSIQITIEPIGGVYVADCGYEVRAVSVETA